MSDLIIRQVLDLWNRYKPTIAVDAIEYDRELKKILSTNLAEVGTDCISRQEAISAICNACGKIDCDKMDKCEKLQLSPANISETPNSSDTISRQSAIDGLRDYLVGKRCPDDGTLTCRLIENEVINKLPSAQPMRGKWERDGHHIKCDQCGEWMCDRDREGWDIPKNYCPNCGAKMEVNSESN